MIGQTCSVCDRIHTQTEVVVIGRFLPEGPAGYRAHPYGPIRETRAAAQLDVCSGWSS